MSRKLKITLGIFIALGVASAALTFAVYSLQGKIDSRLEKGWVLPPLEVYSQGIILSLGRKMPLNALQQEIELHEYTARDYEKGDNENCSRMSGLKLKEESKQCLWFRREQVLVAWDENGFISEVWRGDPWVQVASHAIFPRLITQFYNQQPILQQNTPLSDMPLYCLQATTAIEDRDFLEHRGVSITGTIRAILRNLKAGRFAEGGSTITQQLVKNFFLTPQKTIKRKLSEQLLAVMLESQITKDQILEMYLNVIYMGQSGPYQVLGFGSASEFYFGKPVSHLNLPECALLGAIINNPGKFSPFAKNNGEAGRNRREQVLRKMMEDSMISQEQFEEAKSAPLPQVETKQRQTQAPYFVISALKEFHALDLPAEEGARLYTTLDPEIQNLMLSSIAKVMPAVEARIKKPSKQPLQVAALTVDLATAQVLALTGGRDYRTTQYNRAYDSRRQVGSIVKPFVYLSAVMQEHDPMTPVVDEPFEWKVGKITWKPHNYDKQYRGTVPYFYALANSLNIPAAKIGQEMGLDKIADLISESGIRAKVPMLPSLTLGAFELTLWEVAQGYSAIARFGKGDRIHTLIRVEDIKGQTLYERGPATDIELDPRGTAVVTGMLRQTFEVGSARAARAWGIQGQYAGKTGTTSDTKDAWFSGFNSRILTIVWVGYDDNTAMGLTGASAALPIWTEIAKNYAGVIPPGEFKWPEGVEIRDVKGSEITEKFPSLTDMPESLQLTFADWAY
jgi:penicillin-binding protein 1B